MQIGIDLGATKIEYVLLDDNNKEIKRGRVSTPENYEHFLLGQWFCQLLQGDISQH